jgi:dipeptidyl aminopeptidase/acylaminoacyl peptidase
MNFDPVADAELLGPFSAPTLVPELAATNEDDDPTLTDDVLEIHWESQRSGTDLILMSTRTALGAPWSPPVVAAQLDSGGEACPEISADGLTIMFSSYRGGGGNADIYIATRATRTSPWSTPVAVPELNSAANDYCAIVTDSGLEVFFHSERIGGPGMRDLYRATRPSTTSSWEPPTLIDELNTAGEDESAFPLPGALEIVFTSQRTGSRDLFRAARSAVDQPFGTPTPLDQLNTPADESDVWLSRDGRTLFFSSNRDGDPEIYEASRM